MFINLDGNYWPSGTPVIPAESRGFRYGEGLFETMRLQNGRIPLLDLHLGRLLSGLALLGYRLPPAFTRSYIKDQAFDLWQKNGQLDPAIIRLTLFRGEGSLREKSDPATHFLVETATLRRHSSNPISQGTTIGIFPDGRKAIDRFSHLKSNNYLLYAMAARFARLSNWDDCLVLNSYDRICEGNISNLFCIKDEVLYTPPLTEGCVAGIMRKLVIEQAADAATLRVEERPVSIPFLEDADEVFLTNAVRGIWPVLRFGSRVYGDQTIFRLREAIGTHIFR